MPLPHTRIRGTAAREERAGLWPAARATAPPPRSPDILSDKVAIRPASTTSLSSLRTYLYRHHDATVVILAELSPDLPGSNPALSKYLYSPHLTFLPSHKRMNMIKEEPFGLDAAVFAMSATDEQAFWSDTTATYLDLDPAAAQAQADADALEAQEHADADSILDLLRSEVAPSSSEISHTPPTSTEASTASLSPAKADYYDDEHEDPIDSLMRVAADMPSPLASCAFGKDVLAINLIRGARSSLQPFLTSPTPSLVTPAASPNHDDSPSSFSNSSYLSSAVPSYAPQAPRLFIEGASVGSALEGVVKGPPLGVQAGGVMKRRGNLFMSSAGKFLASQKQSAAVLKDAPFVRDARI